jgi:DNA polymerase II
MKGYILDASYRVINDKAHVLLFGKSEKGEPFLTTHQTQAYFFIQEKDLKKAQKIEDFDFKKTKLKTFNGKKVIKIILDIPSEVSKLKKALEEEEIETFEADIPFARRFLIDNKIQADIEIEGDYDMQEQFMVFKEPTIKPSSANVKLRILSIDIETDLKFKEIYCVSLATDKIREVIIRSDNKKLKGTINVASEEELLETFLERIKEIDPDIITGWYVIDADFQLIKKRCEKYEIPFTLGRTNKETRINTKKGFFSTSKAHAQGRQILDTMQLIKDTTKLNNYKLETAAQHFLGEGKLLQGAMRYEDIEDFFHNDQQKLVDYNLKDSVLVLDILKKSDVLSLQIKRTKLTGLMLDQVKGNISSLDCIYLKKLRDKGFVAPSVRHRIKEELVKGGYVMDPIPGIYSNIMVFDFKSLYPSIVRTFNIDPLMFGKKGIKAPNGATFSKEFGIMPEIIQKLFEVRQEYRKKKDEVGRYAIKILMNSFYGAMASPLCRFYNLDLANGITSFAQMLIKDTAKMIEKEGHKVIYSDTDSCFVVASKDPKKIGKALEKKINSLWDARIKKEYGITSYLELEFEKTYTKFIMPRTRSGTKGAKKRYAGLVDGELQIVGLEAVRGDWTQLAKTFQIELLKKVFAEKDPSTFVKKYIQDLKKGKYDKQLIYKKSLRKPLDQYTKTTPPHVKAARQLKEFKGKIVEYVYTTNGVEPIQLQKSKLDYDHYIEKQIKPLAQSILLFYDIKFEELLSGQKNLFSF